MITFRRLTILFFIVIMALNLLMILNNGAEPGFFIQHAGLLYSMSISLYLVVSVVLAFLPCSGFHHPVICRGRTGKQEVAITFDDGPDPRYTPQILETLARHGVKAAFFCIGHRITGNEALLLQIARDGHILGNHSYSHSPWFDLFSAGRMRREMERTTNELARVINRVPRFFRPPFGVVNPMVSKALKSLPLQTVCWTIRTLDTLNRDPETILKNILGKIEPGAIILLHDHTTFTQEHLDSLIRRIQEKGYRIVPLDTLIETAAYVK